MSLADFYNSTFAKQAETKKAEPEAAVAEETAAEAKVETAAAATETAELTDADLDKALEGMSEADMEALAKDVAGEIKASQAAEKAESEKMATEYFAAGRIFARGFIEETKAAAAAPKTETKVAEPVAAKVEEKAPAAAAAKTEEPAKAAAAPAKAEEKAAEKVLRPIDKFAALLDKQLKS